MQQVKHTLTFPVFDLLISFVKRQVNHQLSCHKPRKSFLPATTLGGGGDEELRGFFLPLCVVVCGSQIQTETQIDGRLNGTEIRGQGYAVFIYH